MTGKRLIAAGILHAPAETGDPFWVSGVKERGANSHPAEPRIEIVIDEDAKEAFKQLRQEGSA